MNAQHFDRLTRSLANRFTRRQAVVQGAAGSAAAALAVVGGCGAAAVAQEGTPGATPTAASDSPSFLFVQSFQSGSFTPEAGQEGTFTLTLSGGIGYTVYFSDRPDRTYGMEPTPRFFAQMDFSPANPPNATLVLQASPEEELIVVLELTEPTYDVISHTATYRATVLTEFDDLRGVVQQRPVDDHLSLPSEFGSSNLFIDSGKAQFLGCCDHELQCILGDPWYNTNARIMGTLGTVPFCGGCGGIWCGPCNNHNDECNAKFPACNGQCTEYWGTGCVHNLDC
jgi:hypothetical protein